MSAERALSVLFKIKRKKKERMSDRNLTLSKRQERLQNKWIFRQLSIVELVETTRKDVIPSVTTKQIATQTM